jgi:regulator of protease activity HflC (stomatin/prohibitin superfamily)
LKKFRIATLALLSTIIFANGCGCSTVGPGNLGVVTDWGEIKPDVKNEGLHFHKPWGIHIHNVPTRVQKMEVTASASSKDLQVVTTKLALNFKLDPKHVVQIFKEIGNLDSVSSNIIDPAIQESMKKSTAQFTAAELVTQRANAKKAITEDIKTTLAKSHILVTEVSVTDFKFDEQYQKAVEAKQIAEQRAQQATNDLARIKVEAEQAEARAAGKAKAMLVEAKAEAEAQELLRKTITKEIVYLRAIEKWDGHQPQIVGEGGALVNLAGFSPGK